jgi:hypothetical protein
MPQPVRAQTPAKAAVGASPYRGEETADKTDSEAEPHPAVAADKTSDVGRIGFLLEDGTMKYLTFPSSPLGMTFQKTTPVTIKGVLPNTNAEALGVQKGWIVAEVCGEDTTQCDMEATRKLLVKMACVLPKKPLPP